MKGLVQLRVKIKSLAVEARIIRLEEQRAKKRHDTALLVSLEQHRKYVVRSEARHSQLAYAFLRGKPYDMVETKWLSPRMGGRAVSWGSVESIAKRFSDSAWDAKAFTEWCKSRVAVPATVAGS